MKRFLLFVLFSLSVIPTLWGQLEMASADWNPIGNVDLNIISSEVDKDVLWVNGQSNEKGQGVSYTFGGVMNAGNSVEILTSIGNLKGIEVQVEMELYNVTDQTSLIRLPVIIIPNESSEVLDASLTYVFKQSDAGDVLQIRFVRTDDGSVHRDFTLNTLRFNGQEVPLSYTTICPVNFVPDLKLLPSNQVIDDKINLIVSRFSDDYLGKEAPSKSELEQALSAYKALNIQEKNGKITGFPISSFEVVSFLKTFAKHLKFNPSDINIANKANNTIWLVSKQFCSGFLPKDTNLYKYEDFARPSVLLQEYLSAETKALFSYTLYEHSERFLHFWDAEYDETYQLKHGTINTDVIHNIGDVLLAYAMFFEDRDKRYQYMRAYTRFIERFLSYTPGTSDGIKVDGSGFHHKSAYNNYMYAYQSVSRLLGYLIDTRFQIDETNYKVLRHAVITQFMQSNRFGVQPLSTAGRNPQNRMRQFDRTDLKQLANIGGDILKLKTPDPVLLDFENHFYSEVDFAHSNESKRPIDGFYAFNYAAAIGYRKDNWMLFNKGFTNALWGSEIYRTQNRYGRYQSYGALEVLYPGDKREGNGFDVNTWDWNHNPGTTVINLPWSKLHAERGRVDELQQKGFAGGLQFSKVMSSTLPNNHGRYGMFAMDFQESENLGFGRKHTSENHNGTFRWKKSNFFFEDFVVCLGSNILNTDSLNTTLTTLFQRLENQRSVVINNEEFKQSNEKLLNVKTANWVISNYGTGFYLVDGNDSLIIKKRVQKNPNQDQVWPSDFDKNQEDPYYVAYIDHGRNPIEKQYEYIIKPNATETDMLQLGSQISGENKLYEILQQDENAHILHYIDQNIWGFAFFNPVDDIPSKVIKEVDAPCLVMLQYDESTRSIKLALSDPDLGLEAGSNRASKTKKIRLTLKGVWRLDVDQTDVMVVKTSDSQTVLEFLTIDGKTIDLILRN